MASNYVDRYLAVVTLAAKSQLQGEVSFDDAARDVFRRANVHVADINGVDVDEALRRVDLHAVQRAAAVVGRQPQAGERENIPVFLAAGVCGKVSSFASDNCTTIRCAVALAYATNCIIRIVDCRAGCLGNADASK